MPHLELIEKPDLATAPEISDEETQAMQRAVVNLFERWELTDAEACVLLGGIGARTYARWKAGQPGKASVDLKARLSNLMGIHKALRLLFDAPERAYQWVKRPNEAFDGRAALDIMLGGQLTDLIRVRRYLDAQRGVW